MPTGRYEDGRLHYFINVLLPVIAITVVVLFTGLLFGLATRVGTSYNPITFSCSPNGETIITFLYDEVYNPYWQPDLFLTVTFGFGNMDYSLAKGIDVCWDLIVGRCGQVVLAYYTYPIIRRSLSTRMEHAPVHFPVFASIAFDKISSRSLWAVVRDLFGRSKKDPFAPSEMTHRKNRRLPWNWNWRWMAFIFVFAYLLGFPTLISIMTGYQGRSIPWVQRPDGYLEEIADLQVPALVVSDGYRIGLTANAPIYQTNPNFHTLIACKSPKRLCVANALLTAFIIDAGTTLGEITAPPDQKNNTPQACYAASYFTPEYYPTFEAPLKQDTNCSLLAILYGGEYYGSTLQEGGGSYATYTSSNITLSGRVWRLDNPPLQIVIQTGFSAEPEYMGTGNTSMSKDYLVQHGSCLPSGRYEWGFSSLMLLVFCLISTIFALIVTALHSDAYWNGQADRLQYDVNHYRDAVDLVQDVRDKYFGDAIYSMTAEDLKARLERRERTIALDTPELPASRMEEKRLRREAIRSRRGPNAWQNRFKGFAKRKTSDANVLFHRVRGSGSNARPRAASSLQGDELDLLKSPSPQTQSEPFDGKSLEARDTF